MSTDGKNLEPIDPAILDRKGSCPTCGQSSGDWASGIIVGLIFSFLALCLMSFINDQRYCSLSVKFLNAVEDATIIFETTIRETRELFAQNEKLYQDVKKIIDMQDESDK